MGHGQAGVGWAAARGGVEVVPRLRGRTPLFDATPLREALTSSVALARNAITKEPARSILAWSAKNTKGGMHFYTNVAEEDGSYACADGCRSESSVRIAQVSSTPLPCFWPASTENEL